MSNLKIIIGEKNYSSWSLRGWLSCRPYRACVRRTLVWRSIRRNFMPKIDEINPSRKVPALYHGDILIWDSLAIIDYCARIAPDRYLVA